MKVQSINSFSANKNYVSLDMRDNNINLTSDSIPYLKQVSGKFIFSQMPNITFGIYRRPVTGPYNKYIGSLSPEVELEKYHLRCKIDENLERRNYLAALYGKIELARINRTQGKESEAFLIENSIRDLYKQMPMYHRDAAKKMLSEYNIDMAKYIDEDIKKY